MLIRQITPEIAELIGIIIGDGHIGFYPSYKHFRLTISLNSETDLFYLKKRVLLLIRKVFKANPEIYFQPGEKNVKCRFYSKEVILWLISLGLPFKNKAKKVGIPDTIKRSKKLIIPCIRGIFDTDGSLFKKYGKYAQVEFRSYSRKLQEDLSTALKDLGFSPSISKKHNHIFLHRQGDVIKFFCVVGSSNPKHIVKFNHWIEFGFVPSTSKIIKDINEYKGKLPFFYKEHINF